MHTFVKRALWGALIAGGMTLIGATAASAAETGGDDGILSGTQLEAPISIPITVVDNAISLLGSSSVETPAPAPAPAPTPEPAAAPEATTDGSDGIASGTQAVVGVTLPVTVSGNSIAVLGTADSDGASAGAAPVAVAPEVTTGGIDGILSGTQGIVSVDVPVTVSGNAIAVLGDSLVESGTMAAPAAPGATADAAADAAVTDGSDSLLGGTQVIAPVAAPVAVVGNAISLLGESAVTGGTASSAPGTESGTDPLSLLAPLAPLTSGVGSLLGGSQLALPISLPVTIAGNAIGVLGQSTVTGSTPVPGTDPGGPNPGTDPGGPNPGVNPGGTGGALPAAAGGGALALTGGTGALPLALMALALLGAGGMLLRRRA